MSAYTVDAARLLDLVGRAREVSRNIERRLAEVTEAVDGLHLDWDGDAADAHRAAHETWTREVQDMSVTLTRLESTVSDARDRYLGNAAHNAAMWP